MKIYVSYYYAQGESINGFGNVIFNDIDVLNNYEHIEQLQTKIDEHLNEKYNVRNSNTVILYFKEMEETNESK